MPNRLFSAWVKNVYSLRQTRGNSSDLLPTARQFTTPPTLLPVQNIVLFPRFTHSFLPHISTDIFGIPPLLFCQLSQVSTYPITTTTNENLRKE